MGRPGEGYTPEPEEQPAAQWQSASPGYFEAMGIAVREGRAFTAADDAQAPPVMMVNQSFARKYWPGGSALGPLTFVAAPLLLAGAGLLASYLPARRAARADPRAVLQEG